MSIIQSFRKIVVGYGIGLNERALFAASEVGRRIADIDSSQAERLKQQSAIVAVERVVFVSSDPLTTEEAAAGIKSIGYILAHSADWPEFVQDLPKKDLAESGVHFPLLASSMPITDKPGWEFLTAIELADDWLLQTLERRRDALWSARTMFPAVMFHEAAAEG